MKTFIRFALLSGCGWLLDLGLLLLLVVSVGTPPALANVVSSAAAASLVFVASRVLVFRKDKADRLHVRLAMYVLYTLATILAASAAVGVLVHLLTSASGAVGTHSYTPTVASAVAKIVVTPPQLVLNFWVSRFLHERPALGALRAGG